MVGRGRSTKANCRNTSSRKASSTPPVAVAPSTVIGGSTSSDAFEKLLWDMETGVGVPHLGRAQRPCSASRARCSAAVDVAAREASFHRHSLGCDRVVAVETPGNARRGDVPNSFEGIVQTDLIWQQARPENGARTACEVVQSGSVAASASVTDTGDTGRLSAHTRGGEDVPGRTRSRQSSPRSFSVSVRPRSVSGQTGGKTASFASSPFPPRRDASRDPRESAGGLVVETPPTGDAIKKSRARSRHLGRDADATSRVARFRKRVSVRRSRPSLATRFDAGARGRARRLSRARFPADRREHRRFRGGGSARHFLGDVERRDQARDRRAQQRRRPSAPLLLERTGRRRVGRGCGDPGRRRERQVRGRAGDVERRHAPRCRRAKARRDRHERGTRARFRPLRGRVDPSRRRYPRRSRR